MPDWKSHPPVNAEEEFVAPFVDSLDGLGATGAGSHSPNEDLELPSIERATIRTAILIYRLTRP